MATEVDWVEEASRESFPASDAPAWPAAVAGAADVSLDVLIDRAPSGGPRMPESLRVRYGGGITLTSPCLYANFVSSVDGVVAFDPAQRNAGSVISGRSPEDRFVMGLLRAHADAVLIGAGTLRTTPNHEWIPEAVFPALAIDFAALRRTLGLAARPRLLVVTASGRVDLHHPALQHEATIYTTEEGAQRIGTVAAGRSGLDVCVLEDRGRIPVKLLLDIVRAEGHMTLLTEGGPTLMSELIGAGLLDELFLTVSPRIIGRSLDTHRLAFAEGVAFTPAGAPRLELKSLRVHDSYLFLRYAREV